MAPNVVPMTKKRPRPEHVPPPLVQVVPGLAHVVGSRKSVV